MARLKLIKATKQEVSAADINNGAVSVATDTHELFIDLNDNRGKITDLYFYTYDVDRITDLTPLAGKLYFVEETGKLWIYLVSWISISSSITDVDEESGLSVVDGVLTYTHEPILAYEGTTVTQTSPVMFDTDTKMVYSYYYPIKIRVTVREDLSTCTTNTLPVAAENGDTPYKIAIGNLIPSGYTFKENITSEDLSYCIELYVEKK